MSHWTTKEQVLSDLATVTAVGACDDSAFIRAGQPPPPRRGLDLDDEEFSLHFGHSGQYSGGGGAPPDLDGIRDMLRMAYEGTHPEDKIDWRRQITSPRSPQHIVISKVSKRTPPPALVDNWRERPHKSTTTPSLLQADLPKLTPKVTTPSKQHTDVPKTPLKVFKPSKLNPDVDKVTIKSPLNTEVHKTPIIVTKTSQLNPNVPSFVPRQRSNPLEPVMSYERHGECELTVHEIKGAVRADADGRKSASESNGGNSELTFDNKIDNGSAMDKESALDPVKKYETNDFNSELKVNKSKGMLFDNDRESPKGILSLPGGPNDIPRTLSGEVDEDNDIMTPAKKEEPLILEPNNNIPHSELQQPSRECLDNMDIDKQVELLKKKIVEATKADRKREKNVAMAALLRLKTSTRRSTPSPKKISPTTSERLIPKITHQIDCKTQFNDIATDKEIKQQFQAPIEDQLEQISTKMEHATLNECPKLERGSLNESTKVEHATFNKYTKLERGSLNESTKVEHATFNKYTKLERPTLNECPNLECLTLNESTKLERAIFNESTKLEHATLNVCPKLEHGSLNESTKVERATFNESTKVERATFNESTKVERATFNESTKVERATFNESTKLERATFNESTKLERPTLNECPKLECLTLNESTKLERATLNECPKFECGSLNESTKLERGSLNKSPISEYESLNESAFDRGSLNESPKLVLFTPEYFCHPKAKLENEHETKLPEPKNEVEIDTEVEIDPEYIIEQVQESIKKVETWMTGESTPEKPKYEKPKPKSLYMGPVKFGPKSSVPPPTEPEPVRKPEHKQVISTCVPSPHVPKAYVPSPYAARLAKQYEERGKCKPAPVDPFARLHADLEARDEEIRKKRELQRSAFQGPADSTDASLSSGTSGSRGKRGRIKGESREFDG